VVPTILFENSKSDASSLTTPSAASCGTSGPSGDKGKAGSGFGIGAIQRVVQSAAASLSGKKKRAKKSNVDKQKKKVRKDEAKAAAEEKAKEAKMAKEARRKQREADKAAKDAEAARLTQVRSKIDVIVRDFKPEYYNCIKIHQVKNTKNAADDAEYNVASEFVVHEGKANELRYKFDDFTNTQLRRLCVTCNIKGGGNFTNWQAVTALAKWVTAGTAYTESNIANPFSNAEDKRVNTYLRIVNVCFLPSMVQRFVNLNDRKERKDYEESHGSCPVKDFFVEASNICNDTNMNHLLQNIAGSEEDGDSRLYGWVVSGDLNLNDFTTQTYQTCQSKAVDMLKSRELCREAMEESGQHDSDFWNFCKNKKFRAWRVNMKEIPARAVYYCHVMCQQYPAIDGKFSDRLSEALKSDSTSVMSGEAGVNARKTARADKEMLKKMDAVMTQHKESSERSYNQRQQFIDLHKSTNDSMSEREDWKEYTSMSERFMSLKKDPNNNALLVNMAVRLWTLEQRLGIPKASTVTAGYHREN
jgi:hypothetical protein